MAVIDLNCDLGESYGAYKIGMDEEVIPFVTSANIACGFHAGDPLVMERTVALCKEHGVRIGAHPGFPDLVGFGRRNMALSAEEIKALVKYQIGAIKAFCTGAGVRLWHVKPHGALYNMAAEDYTLAKAICQAVKEVDDSLVLLGLSGSELIRAAKATGVFFEIKVFEDLGFKVDGTRVPGNLKGSLIKDEELAVKRVIRMVKERKVEAVDGRAITIQADSVCVHGDGPQALAFVKKIRESLLEEGISVKGF